MKRDTKEQIMIASLGIAIVILGATYITPLLERLFLNTIVSGSIFFNYNLVIISFSTLFIVCIMIIFYIIKNKDKLDWFTVFLFLLTARNEDKNQSHRLKQPDTNLDSIVITSIYIAILSVAGGIIVYLANHTYKQNLYLSVGSFVILLGIEAVLLLYRSDIISSLPTPCIVISVIPVIIYKLFKIRDQRMVSWNGFKIFISYIRYILLNPAWSRDKRNKSDPFNGLRGIDWDRDNIVWINQKFVFDKTARCDL